MQANRTGSKRGWVVLAESLIAVEAEKTRFGRYRVGGWSRGFRGKVL